MAKIQATQVELTVRQKAILEKKANKRTVSKHYEQRIKIILKANEGKGNNEIKRELGITNTTVRTWRNRWKTQYRTLLEFEAGTNNQGVTDRELLEKMLEILTDVPRQGRPCDISMAKKQEIIAMACKEPKDYGLPFTHWSHKLLAEAVVKENILEQISSRYIGVILKKTNCNHTNQNTGFIQT